MVYRKRFKTFAAKDFFFHRFGKRKRERKKICAKEKNDLPKRGMIP